MLLHRVAVVGFACVSLLLLPACDWIATVSVDSDGNRAEGRSPSLLARGTTTTLVVAGDGFAAGTVASSSGGVHVDSTTYVSEHALRVAVHVDPQTAPGPRTLAVSIPAPGPGDYGIASSVTNCECLNVTQ
jgi:hypothetical protein